MIRAFIRGGIRFARGEITIGLWRWEVRAARRRRHKAPWYHTWD